MPRTLWSGAISFGLVNIPVELYPAEDHNNFKLSMLDRRDFSPIGYKRYSKKSGREVPWQDIVKGYEHAKGKYVVLSEEDFRRANVKATENIEIAEFVPTGEIAPQYFDTPYYLAPTKPGGKAYALLRDALAATQMVAVAQFVMRGTPHLAALVPDARMLILNTLRYDNELRHTSEIELALALEKQMATSTRELTLTKRLVDDMAGHWDPSAFHDSYHDDLMKRIREKLKRGESHQVTEADTKFTVASHPAEVIDLAALLKKSLKGGKPQAIATSARKAPSAHSRGSTKSAARRKQA